MAWLGSGASCMGQRPARRPAPRTRNRPCHPDHRVNRDLLRDCRPSAWRRRVRSAGCFPLSADRSARSSRRETAEAGVDAHQLRLHRVSCAPGGQMSAVNTTLSEKSAAMTSRASPSRDDHALPVQFDRIDQPAKV
jgi:hypothetical protein